MADGSFRLIATMVAKEGKTDELRAALLKLIAPTRAEAGCRVYELWQCRENPRQFRMVEEWASDADLAAHFETAHMQEGLQVVPGLLEGELALEKYLVVG